MMSSIPRRLPRGVIFDWDNTLVNSWQCIEAPLNETLVAMGYPLWSREKIYTDVRLSLKDSFPKLFGEGWERAREIYYQSYLKHSLTRITALEGAERVLRLLKERSVYMCVVSNKLGDFLRLEVKFLGWSDFFGRCVGSGDAENDKPTADPVVLALQPQKMFPHMFPREDVWFVGDTSIDMECAYASGCLPILLGSCTDEALREYVPALQVDNHDDFIEFIDTLGCGM